MASGQEWSLLMAEESWQVAELKGGINSLFLMKESIKDDG